MERRTWWMVGAALCALASGGSGQPPATLQPGGDRPMPALTEAPAGIAWGPGRDVQAGVRARLWAASQHAGRFVMDVYVRNRSKHAVVVECPSFLGLSVASDRIDYTTLVQSPLIYCTPTVRDSKGRKVGMQYKLGTEHMRYSIGPGQVASVAHWMLHTMPPSAKTAATADYKQVVFVDPGKYQVTCDVSAAWEPGRSRPTTLRTGAGSFEVTTEDLKD